MPTLDWLTRGTYPKTAKAIDLMVEAPTTISDIQLRDPHHKVFPRELTPMQIAKWPLWAKALYSVFVVYSALLCVAGVAATLDSRSHGYGLKWPDLVMQTLLMLFLPLLLVAFRSPHAASGALLLLALADAILIVTSRGSAGNSSGAMLIGSLVFLGLPVLGATVFLRRMASSRSKING